jgi:hypothetical protein
MMRRRRQKPQRHIRTREETHALRFHGLGQGLLLSGTVSGSTRHEGQAF